MQGEPACAAPWLELTGARKSFGAVAALVDGHLALWPGEVHALLGENGAGKSTLVKLLAGVFPHDAGELRIDGRPVRLRSPAQARDAGIAVIYQEPTLFGDLSVAENVYMGRQPRRRLGLIDHPRMHAAATALLHDLGVRLDPRAPVRGLSIADQQVVEIAKALSQEARVLIMDEPTAALSRLEVQRLFAIVERLRRRQVAILFITHRLEEVFTLAQRVTIMRDGAVVHRAPTAELQARDIVRLMVGRELNDYYPRAATKPGDVVLQVRGLARAGVFKDIGFDVRAGEIVALAGLVGSGRSEIARALFGIDPADRGQVHVAGRPLALGDPRRAIAAGVAMVPEDRRLQGLVMDLSIARNAALTVLPRLARLGLVPPGAECQLAGHWGRQLQLKAHDLEAPVAQLSGGNQQKVVLGKWLATGPRVLIIDEPTRGIDVGAKAELYRTLAGLLEAGLAVLMISSELPEVLGMADRVIVIHEGRIAAELARAQMSEEAIMSAALGRPLEPQAAEVAA
jgi:rhamnose transport system ATP-binding protein